MKQIILTVLLWMLMQPCFATENISTLGKHHIIGINLGVGKITTDLPIEQDDNEISSGIYYGYKYDTNWTINAGISEGDSIGCAIQCVADTNLYRKIKYKSYLLNLKGSIPLSNRWSMFGKIGANYYQSEFSGEYRAKISENGVGALFAAGFEVRAFNGVGFAFEAKRLSMGDIAATNYTLNFSYMF
ncbi:outer membrane beta-barrel protein [Litorilituus lipolyticus]|uniref:Porin family protein n=1 Tax=Litorilituus lipolyticus TaxID=2491017 RepID=A0A502KNQ4_9GAMM|nr:outer membrane beta-barrel protein [Litorilituus lipolyticus]TPH13330.1 porin family protein [Litorilituus lipolyticus]